MKRFLITGFSGFVSRHFLEHLDDTSKHGDVEVLGIDIHKPDFTTKYKNINCSFENVDLLNIEKLQKVIKTFKPDYILHLASFSSVAYSWKNPVSSFQNNMDIFLNLAESIKEYNKQCRVLSVGSSEEYGVVSQQELPLREKHTLNPVSPYAAARVAQELLSKIYVNGYGLDIVMTRSFNHIGPYQKDIFVISSFAKQLQIIKNSGVKVGQLNTGDVEIVRDFLDVRDVVRAYYKLLLYGKKSEIYNVCSGVGFSLKNIIEKMADILEIEVVIQIKDEFLRPNDNPRIIGSNDKIKNELSWEPNIPFTDSLNDILNYWAQYKPSN